MEKTQLIEKVNAALANEFEVEESAFAPEASLKEVLELDSLSLVDLVALIENEFFVKIPSGEISTIKTFGDLYDYISSRA